MTLPNKQGNARFMIKMSETVCIPKSEYKELKEDKKIVESLTQLDNSVVKSIIKSLEQARNGHIRRVA